MKPAHLGTTLFLLAVLAACGDAPPPDGGPDPSRTGSPTAAGKVPSDILAALPPEARPYGLDVYTAKCASCHGSLGQGVDKNPSLTGLTPGSMQQKLLDFRSGKIQGAQATTKADLSDAEIAAVSIYAGE